MTRKTLIRLSVLGGLVLILAGIVATRYKTAMDNYAYLTRTNPNHYALERDGKTLLVDMHQEEIDITSAVANGFDPDNFDFGIGKDTIPAIMQPEFERAGQERFDNFPDNEGVLAIEIDGTAKAYPLGLLTVHEVVNDSIAGQPFAACYCPLAGLGAIYERETKVGEITLGTSGWTYDYTFLLYDHTTDSIWFPNDEGLESIGGKLEGGTLAHLPFEQLEWGEWKAKHPDTLLCVGGVNINQQNALTQPEKKNPEDQYEFIGSSTSLELD